MIQNIDMNAVISDVTHRIKERENGFQLMVDPEISYPSIETVYVFVRVIGGGGKAEDLNEILEVVEKESSERFHMDVCVLPAPPGLDH